MSCARCNSLSEGKTRVRLVVLKHDHFALRILSKRFYQIEICRYLDEMYSQAFGVSSAREKIGATV